MQQQTSPPVHHAIPSTFDLSTLALGLGSDSLEQRLAALWFGTAQPVADEREVSPLRAAVLWEGLETFLTAEGWQIAATVPVEPYSGEVTPLDLRSLPHDSETSLRVPTHAAVFAHCGGDRRLVAFHERGAEWTVRVACTSRDLAACWARWERRAFAGSLLRGRVIDPQGRRLLGQHPTDWSDLYLPEATVKALQRESARMTRFGGSEGRALGLRPPRGLLLYGPLGFGTAAVAEVIAAQSPFTALWPSAEDLSRDPGDVLELARSLAPSLLILDDLDGLALDSGFNRWPAVDILSEARNRLARLDREPTVALIATARSRQSAERGRRERPKLFDCSIEIPAADGAAARRYVETRLRRSLDEADADRVGSALAGFPRAALDAVLDLAIDTSWGQEVARAASGASEPVEATVARIGVDEVLAAADAVRSRRRGRGPEGSYDWADGDDHDNSWLRRISE